MIKDNGFLFCLSDCIPSFVLEMNAALDDKYDTNIKLNQLIYLPHEKMEHFQNLECTSFVYLAVLKLFRMYLSN
jgi:hypothetical protein